MNIVDIILDKRYGRALSYEQIMYFVDGVTDRSIPDYQISALLMAIVLNGMDEREMTSLTLEMADSGEHADLSYVGDITVDKHSTGGVGDKITPLVMPLCRSFGAKIVKLSGRGLGFTGGTVDKFSSIRGFNVDVPKTDFPRLVNECGMVISGQTPDLAPADKILYALRDVTGTVDSIPLIASSIMSKKIAGGADAIVLDVTCGSGAFMQTEERARELANAMIKIGRLAQKKTSAVITDMDQPLGRTCGNVIEMEEVYETLSGNGASDVVEVATAIGARMVKLAGKAGDYSDDDLINECRLRLGNGVARDEYLKLVRSQGGIINDNGPEYVDRPHVIGEVKAPRDGFVGAIRADEIGHASVLLGAGRIRKDDAIDLGAGIRFLAKRGDEVHKGDTLCVLYIGNNSSLTPDSEKYEEISERIANAYTITADKPEVKRSVIDVLGDQ
ncbi:MAG: thymidine phosphorylase [Clostridiales bacterium]|nr:thymidine phosphorylase [Clostridiales bacterium]